MKRACETCRHVRSASGPDSLLMCTAVPLWVDVSPGHFCGMYAPTVHRQEDGGLRGAVLTGSPLPVGVQIITDDRVPSNEVWVRWPDGRLAILDVTV